MPIPLIIGGIAVLASGLFVGSQIDDAIEKPVNVSVIPGQGGFFTTGNILKTALLAGTALVTIQVARQSGILK